MSRPLLPWQWIHNVAHLSLSTAATGGQSQLAFTVDGCIKEVNCSVFVLCLCYLGAKEVGCLGGAVVSLYRLYIAHGHCSCMHAAMHCIILSMLTGKSGHVAARLSSSLSSLGIPSQFVHAAEWGHGDLGGWRHGMTLSR